MYRKRYPEAARVLLDYAKDIREAVIALVNGNQFSEAQRVVKCLFLPHSETKWRIMNYLTEQVLSRSRSTKTKSCSRMWFIQVH